MASQQNTAMTGGTANDSVLIGSSTGDITHANNPGSRTVNLRDNTGNFSAGDNASNVQGASNPTSVKKDPKTLTSSELVKHLESYEFSDATIKSFSEKKIIGRLFMTMFDQTLKSLNITDEIEVMKLKALKDELSQ